MKSFVLIISCLLSMKSMIAQEFVREEDRKTHKVLLRGKITFQDLLNETTCSWLNTGAKSYQPKQEAVDQLSKVAGDYRFIVFAGTWCSDTKDVLPKFYKVLIESGIDLHAVEMYGVNRAKEALNIEHTLYGIKFVPTIIVMYQFREVGRIVENPNASIEEDLSTMILNDYNKVQELKNKKMN